MMHLSFEGNVYVLDEIPPLLSGGKTILPRNLKFYLIKCCNQNFQTQVSDFDYLNYFLNKAVIVSFKREQSYCMYLHLGKQRIRSADHD